MEPKTILIPFGGRDYTVPALETGFHLARRFKSHVEVWHVAPDPFTVTLSPMYAGAPLFPNSAMDEVKKENRERENRAREKFVHVAENYRIPVIDSWAPGTQGPSSSFHVVTGDADSVLATRGRVVDLIVMARPEKNGERLFAERAAHLIFASGRPVLIIPAAAAPAPTLSGPALIAWNGSAEAAKAVYCSLRLLPDKISIISGHEEGNDGPDPSQEDLASYLARHGIQAEPRTYLVKQSSAAAEILETARELKVEMIVMGAYGHSRLREAILGGVTDYMLRKADIPLLLAH